MRVIFRISTFLIAALFVSGCTITSSGEPRPTETNTSSKGDAHQPREVTLDDVDPCALLSQADYDDFNIDQPGEASKDDRGADQCVWNTDDGFLAVTLVTYEDFEAQVGRTGDIEPADPIKGFPARNLTVSGNGHSCFTDVDVANGQYLSTHVGLFSPKDGESPCQYSYQLANAMMNNLLS